MGADIMRWPPAPWRRQEPAVARLCAPSGCAEAAPAGRLDDENVAFAHLHLEGRAEVLARAVDALYPVAPDLARRAACHPKRRHAAVGGRDSPRHGVAE